MKFVAAIHIEKFDLATNVGLRCVVYMWMRGHTCFSYVRGNSYIDSTTVLYDSHGTAMIKLQKCFGWCTIKNSPC